MKKKQLGLFVKSDEFSICCVQKLDDRLIIHELKTSNDKTLIEHYVRELKDKFKISIGEPFLMNTSQKSIEQLLLVERMGFSVRFVQVTDWKSILQLSRAITEKYIRHTSKDFSRTLEQSILKNINSSRYLGVAAGAVALFCEDLPLGGWENINSLSVP